MASTDPADSSNTADNSLFSSTDPAGVKTGRIAPIDWFRGIAFIAMAIYHLAWDLEFFGWARPGFIQQPEWVYFARSIASSFLILIGISIVLGHGQAFHRRKFLIRLGKIIAAALLITVATYFAMPGGFIYFGILHSIAVTSIMALLVMPLPWFVLAVLSPIFFWLPSFVSFDFLSNWFGYWTGLASYSRPSNDFVPIFPWFSAVLAGMALAKLAILKNWHSKLARITSDALWAKVLNFVSRHSLVFYLLHQPVLMSLVWLSVQIIGPPDPTPRFLAACETNCQSTSGEAYCTSFCSCVATEFKAAGLWQPLHQNKLDIRTDPKAQEIINMCSAK